MSTVLHIDGTAITLENLSRRSGEVSFRLGKKTYNFRSKRQAGDGWMLEQETASGVWQRINGAAWPSGKDATRVQIGALEARISEVAAGVTSSEAGSAVLSPAAPMPGLVRKLMVKAGDQVKTGQPLAVMEAMKLQITLHAGGAARVDKILVREGDMIGEGTELVKLIPTGKKK